ncbi:MAG: O-antigen ligase family protein [Candidatus Promineifilaceae bacterium]|nr:O-antigen ligase family protein [Chloroflexota bacterium]
MQAQKWGEWLGPGVAAAAIGLLIAFLPLATAAALLLVPAVLILIYLFPLFGLGLALLAGPFGALESVLLGPSPLDSGQLLLLVTLVIWLLKGLGRGRVVIPATSLNGPLLLFLTVATLSALGAPSLEIALRELLKWVEILFIIWLVADLRLTRDDLPLWPRFKRQQGLHFTSYLFPLLVLLPALLQAAIGIWQFGLRDDGPVHFLILGRFYRAYGTFEQPNPFGGYMALNASLALGMLVGLLVYYDVWGGVSAAWRNRRFIFQTLRPIPNVLWLGFVGLTAAATSLALVMSWSRGAWLGFAAAGGALILFLPRKRWQGIVLAGLALATLWVGLQFNLLPASLAERLTSWQDDFQFGDVRGVDINDANYAVLERLAHWQAALDMARDHLWLGVGFGNYESAYRDYALINWPYPLGHAHNYYLNLLAEVGVIGTVAYLLLWGTIFGQTISLLKLTDWRFRGLVLGLLAAWTALTIHHLLDKLYVNNLYVHLGAMTGLLVMLKAEAKELQSPD